MTCDGTGNPGDLSTFLMGAMSTDNCMVDSESNTVFNTISGCGDADTEVYQFTATDTEGNQSQCLASFTIEDTTAPMITAAAMDGDSDCDNANSDLLDWLNNFGDAEATDGCGLVTWSYEFDGAAMTGCSGVTSLNVIFIATDDCGNTATTTASFSVDDTADPIMDLSLIHI